MIEYTIYEAQRKNLANPAGKRVEIAVYRFRVEPHNGDTVDIHGTAYRIKGRHWLEDGAAVLMVAKLGGSVV